MSIEGYGHIVLASTSGELTASLIRLVTRSKFSHALVTMPPILGVPMCAEDSSAGVDMLRFDTGYLQNPKETVEVWQVNVDEAAKTSGLTAVLGALEQSYGFLELPWFAWRAVCKAFGKDIKSQDNWSQKDSVCSGLVRDRYMAGAGIGGVLAGFGKNSVSPQDIRDAMASRPDLFTLVYTNFPA